MMTPAEQEAVLAALAGLREMDRDVFILHRFEHMTYTQICEHCGISHRRVIRGMTRAIGAVHEALGGYA